jgi:hypothetical protein
MSIWSIKGWVIDIKIDIRKVNTLSQLSKIVDGSSANSSSNNADDIFSLTDRFPWRRAAILRLEAIYAWRKASDNGWMAIAPKEPSIRKQLRDDASEDLERKTGVKLEKPALSLVILKMGEPKGKEFRKNQCFSVGTAVPLSFFTQYTPAVLKSRADAMEKRNYWRKKYEQSLASRREGERIRKEMKDRKTIVRFCKDSPTVITFHQHKLKCPIPCLFASRQQWL